MSTIITGADIPSTNQLYSILQWSYAPIWASKDRKNPLRPLLEWLKLILVKLEEAQAGHNTDPSDFETIPYVRALYPRALETHPGIFDPKAPIGADDKDIDLSYRRLADITPDCIYSAAFAQTMDRFLAACIAEAKLGEHLTDVKLARFMATMLELTDDEQVIDPAAGTGLLLATCAGHLRQDVTFQWPPHVQGIEIDAEMATICKMTMLLHGIDPDAIRMGDCLNHSFLESIAGGLPSKGFDVAVCHPPLVYDPTAPIANDRPYANPKSGNQLAHTTFESSAAPIFERAISMLRPGGRVGCILPDGLLNNQGHGDIGRRFRDFLVRHGRLDAVVSLPSALFPGKSAQTKASAVFFTTYTEEEKRRFSELRADAPVLTGRSGDDILHAVSNMDYQVFLACDDDTPDDDTLLPPDGPTRLAMPTSRQRATAFLDVIAERWLAFRSGRSYQSDDRRTVFPMMSEIWRADASHRIDPKYHVHRREVHAIPRGWEEHRISDLLEPSGASLTRNVASNWLRRFTRDLEAPLNPIAVLMSPETRILFPDKRAVASPIFITVSKDGLVQVHDISDEELLHIASLDMLPGRRNRWHWAEPGDIVFSRTGLVHGAVAVVPDEYGPLGPLMVKDGYDVCRVRQGKDGPLVDPRFLVEMLRTSHYQHALRMIADGNASVNITMSSFMNLTVACPTFLEEQTQLIRCLRNARLRMEQAKQNYQELAASFNDLLDGVGDTDDMLSRFLDE